MAVAPDLRDDDELSRRLVADVNDSRRGVLDAGNAIVEARGAYRFAQLLSKEGWQPDEPWTSLRRDLSGSSPVDDERVEEKGVRIETAGPDQVDPWVAVHWSAFKGTPFGEEERRTFRDSWLTMADGPFYHRARSLVAFDEYDNGVAVTTVWSAGPGRPGLVEPMGGPSRSSWTWLRRGHLGGRGVRVADHGILQCPRMRRELQRRGRVHLCGGRFTADEQAVTDLWRGA